MKYGKDLAKGVKFKKGFNWLQWKRFILLKIYLALVCLSVWVYVSLSVYKKWKGGAKIGSVIHLIDKPSSLLVDKPSKPILPWLQYIWGYNWKIKYSSGREYQLWFGGGRGGIYYIYTNIIYKWGKIWKSIISTK